MLCRVLVPGSRVIRLRSLIWALCILALIVSQPARHALLTAARLPFTLLRASVRTCWLLPRLPALAQECAALRAELAAREQALAEAREALRHGQQADALRAASPGAGGVVASVIGRSTVPSQHTLLLDRGRADGIAPDAVVVDASGVLGRVVEVHPATALVQLVTDPDSRVAALVERTRETGLLLGYGYGACRLVYLSVDADVEPGDRVVTAGLGGPFPKGALLGTVSHMARNEAAGTAEATVRPAAQLGRAEEVLCLAPAHPAAER